MNCSTRIAPRFAVAACSALLALGMLTHGSPGACSAVAPGAAAGRPASASIRTAGAAVQVYTSTASDLRRESDSDQNSFVRFTFDYPPDWNAKRAPGGGSYVDVETPDDYDGYGLFSVFPLSGEDTAGAGADTYSKVIRAVAEKIGSRSDIPVTRARYGSMVGYQGAFRMDASKLDLSPRKRSALRALEARGVKPLARVIVFPAEANGQRNGLMLLVMTMSSDVTYPGQVGRSGGLKVMLDTLRFGRRGNQ